MEPIAITGFAFRLPQGTNDVNTLWKVLSEGKNLMTDWPKDRINVESFHNAGPHKQNTVRINITPFWMLVSVTKTEDTRSEQREVTSLLKTRGFSMRPFSQLRRVKQQVWTHSSV
jgi:hypothetical protein